MRQYQEPGKDEDQFNQDQNDSGKQLKNSPHDRDDKHNDRENPAPGSADIPKKPFTTVGDKAGKNTGPVARR